MCSSDLEPVLSRAGYERLLASLLSLALVIPAFAGTITYSDRPTWLAQITLDPAVGLRAEVGKC